MPVVSQIDVANLALARIRASQITSIAENTLEGREVRRFYPRAIADCLAGPFDHDWSFANYRTTLAQLVVNDRASEWLFAYAVPSNMASPIRVLPDFNGLGLGLPIPLLGDPYAESWMAQGGYFETPYIIEGQTIYTNTENAVFEYAISDITGLKVSEKIITALELDLGSRLAVPIKGDSKREAELGQAARNAWEIAVAEDRNRHPVSTGGYVSESMMARRGYLSEAS
jgi:hypothetical protein